MYIFHTVLEMMNNPSGQREKNQSIPAGPRWLSVCARVCVYCRVLHMCAHPRIQLSLCVLQGVFTHARWCVHRACVILPGGGFKTHYVRYWMPTV